MATTEDLQSQADILAQMQEAMAGLRDVLAETTDNATNMTNAMQGLLDQVPQMEGAVSKMKEMNDGMKEGADEANKMTDAMKALTGKTKQNNKQIDKGTKGLKKFAAAGAALSFMKGIFDSMVAGLKSIVSFIGSTITAGKNLVTGLFKAWAGTWSTLGKMAKEIHGQGVEIAKAYEEIRGEFGDLASGEGKAVVGMLGDIRRGNEFASKTGLNLYSTIGNQADVIKAVTELAKDMGSKFGQLTEFYKGATVELYILNKGLNLSAEAFNLQREMAARTGQTGKEMAEEYAQMAVGFKKMGVNMKKLGKNFNELAKDVTNFGHMSQKELISTAAYAEKLKISVESLKGVFDKFSNFEDASMGAAKLAEAFGMNVDAMDLLNANSPAEQIDQLRKSFNESGQSVQDLNRHQRAYLEEMTGLKGEDLFNAFDPANMDVSYDDMLKEADKAKKELSPAEAMKEAAKEIKKAFKQMDQKSTTFFGRFKEGFMQGLKYTKPYREFFKALEKALREVFHIGRDLAKQLFGRGGVFTGDAMGFVQKWKAYLQEIVKFFKRLSDNIVMFAKDLKSGKDPSVAVQGFLDRLMESVNKFFNADAVVAWQKTLAGFMKLASKIFERMAIGIINWVAGKLQGIGEALKDNNGVMGAWGEAFMALFEAFKAIAIELWKIAGPPLLEGIQKLWNWAKPYIETALMFMLKAAILKAVLTGAAAALGGAAVKGFVSLFTGFLGKASAGMGAAAKVTPGGAMAVLETNSTALAAQGAKANWAAAMGKMLLIAGFITVGVTAFLAAFYVVMEMVKGRDPKEVMAAGLVMAAIGVAMMGLAGAARAAQAVSVKGLAKLAVMYGMFVGGMYGLGEIGKVLIGVVNDTKDGMPSGDEATAFFVFMGKAMLAGGAALAIAAVASKFANPKTILGLGLLGVAMIGLAGVGWVIAQMFSTIPSNVLAQVGPVLEGLASLMWVVMAAIPVAGLLGLMLMSFPFGTAGVAVLAAGFAVLGTLAGVMVSSLMPTVHQIAGIQIEDPASFKMVAEAIASILTAVTNMMGNIAAIMEAADPGMAGMLDEGSSSMAENLKAMEGVIDAVLCPVVDIIKMLVELAKGAEISKNNVDAIMAIAGVINAIANVMKALTPSPKMLEIIQDANDFWGSGRKQKTMKAMLRAQEKTQAFAISFMEKAKDMISEMLKQAANIKSPEAAKALKAVAEILNVVVNILNAMKPDENQMKLAEKANKFWGGGRAQKTLNAMNRNMQMQLQNIVPIMDSMGRAAKKIFEGLEPVLQIISGSTVDPKIYEALASIIASIMGAVGDMMKGIGPAMTAMSAGLEDNSGPWPWSDPKGPSKAEQMGTMMTGFGCMMETIGKSMGTMVMSLSGVIGTIMNAARAMPDPKGLTPKLEAISKMMEIVGSSFAMLPPIMEMINENFGAESNWYNEVTWYFGGGTHFGGKGLFGLVLEAAGNGLSSLISILVTATNDIKDPNAFKSKIEAISMILKTIGETVKLIPVVMDVVNENFGEGNSWHTEITWYFGGSNGFNGGEGLLIYIMRSAGDGLKALMDQMKVVTKDLKNPEEVGKRIKIVADSMALVATMLGFVGDAMAMMAKYSGGEMDSWSGSIELMFGKVGQGGLMSMIMLEAGYGLKIFMDKIEEVTEDIKNPKRLESRIKVLLLALESVTGMVQALGTIMGLLPSGSNILYGDDISIMMHNINYVMENAADTMKTVVGQIIDFVKPGPEGGLTDLYKYRHTIGILPKVFHAITCFATALQAMSGVGGGDFSKVKGYMEKFSTVFADKAVMKNFKSGMNDLATLPYYTFKKTAKSVASFANMIDESLIPLGAAITRFVYSPGDKADFLSFIKWTVGTDDMDRSKYASFYDVLHSLRKAPAVPKLDKLFDAVALIVISIYAALIPLGQAVADFAKSPGTFPEMRALALFIAGNAEAYGIYDLLGILAEAPKPKITTALTGVKMMELFLKESLIPLSKTIGKATGLMGVKEGNWWEKAKIGGGNLDVPRLAEGVGKIFKSFADFGYYADIEPEDLMPVAVKLGAYAYQFNKVAQALNSMSRSIDSAVKFSKKKVTPDKLVRAAAENIEKLGAVMTSLDDLIVDTTMHKVAEALRGGDTVKVQHNGINIKMKVTVNIEAKELAASLADDHGSYFKVNEARTDGGLFLEEFR